MSRKIEILLVILLIILATIGTLMLTNNNNSIATDLQKNGNLTYVVGEKYTFNKLLDNPNLYCISHGKAFYFGEYECIETGTYDDSRLGYLIANCTNGNRDQDNDPVANAIWFLTGNTTTPGVNYQDILEKAEAATANINPDGGNVSLEGPKNPVIAKDGKYGPFKLTYPTYNGKTQGEVEVTVNGKKIETPENGEFTLSEEDVNYGEKNTIKVTYKAKTYTAEYATFTPLAKVKVTQNYVCKGCGEIFTATGEGVAKQGELIEEKLEEPKGTHGSDCKGEDLQAYDPVLDYYERSEYNVQGIQDLMYIMPHEVDVNESVEFSFWAGKPLIVVNMKKINPKGDRLASVIFNVSVEGGKADREQVSGIEEFTVKADKDANDVKVTLTETVVPDEYAKLTDSRGKQSIILQFGFGSDTWNGGFAPNGDGYPEGLIDEETIDLELAESTKTADLCSDDFILKLVNRPSIKITLDKEDPQGQPVTSAVFSIEVDGGDARRANSTEKVDVMVHGQTVIINPYADRDTVTVTLTETYVSEEFAKFKEPIVLTFSYNGSMWTLSNHSQPGDPEKIEYENETDENSGMFELTIKATNRRTIIVDIEKTDNGGNKIEMTFDVTVEGGVFYDDETTSKTITTSRSALQKLIIVPDGTSDVTLKLKERPSVYYMDPGEITITFSYSGGNWLAHLSTDDSYRHGNISINGNKARFTLKIENIAKIEDLILEKLNICVDNEPIPGITFRIELINAKTLAGAQTIIMQTDSNGQIDLGTLEVINPNNVIQIILQETGVPDITGLHYEGLFGATITITLRHKQSIDSVTVTGGDESFVHATYGGNNVVSIYLENKVTLDLSGKVWNDKQTGLKPVQPPDGLDDDGEPAMEGIKVTLKEASDNSVVQVDGIANPTKTNSKGEYEFKDVPASVIGSLNYYIEFEYDGINYITTQRDAGSNEEIDSDVSEINRQEFNDKFNTIEKDKAIGKSGTEIPLKYDHDGSGKIATLQTRDSDGEVKEEFAMTATTLATTYNRITTDIDMGLVERELNLSALTELEKADVTINGKEATYNYNELIGLQQDDNGNLIFDGNQIANNLLRRDLQYNLFLYASDYNYRIHDYFGTTPYNNPNEGTPGQTNNSSVEKPENNELNIELTYQIALNNLSATDSTVNKIAYYYDENLQLDGVTPTKEIIDGKTYNKIIIPVNAQFNDTNNQALYYLTFTVKKDANRAVYLGTVKNWVEIISYSSNDGCIDNNSAPDNITEYNAEDDSDDARGLNISLQNEERTISGFVFEDNKESVTDKTFGVYDSGEEKVNDVVVQLIEIKEIDTTGDGNKDTKLEYIWQEAVSGYARVNKLPVNGRSPLEQDSFSNGKGEYKFTGFIPGNYIIRFIYGDDEYYDMSIDGYGTTDEQKGNILKYNGQDYKSTKDVGYRMLEFSQSSYNTTSTSNLSSMARDNEARRLEEMAWATSPDRDVVNNGLNINNKDKLAGSWMCAETSIAKMPITENEQDVANGTASSNIVEERNINFGLVKRPEAKLNLEKHITAVTVKSSDGTTIVNVSADELPNIRAQKDFTTYSNTNYIVQVKNVLATATNKDKDNNSRGIWRLEHDIKRYGTIKVSITYTYIISNDGDEDYISNELNTMLDSGTSYSDVFGTLAQQVKQDMQKTNRNMLIGQYLGTRYYVGSTGNTEIPETKVGIPVRVEDYLDASKSVTAEGGIFKEVTDSVSKPYYTSSGVLGNKTVDVLQTENVYQIAKGDNIVLDLKTTQDENTISTGSKFTYESYAAQLIFGNILTSKTGMVAKDEEGNNILSNLAVAGHGAVGAGTQDVWTTDIVPQSDEFIAETFTITVPTGGDKETPTVLITSITAGVVVVAIGIVLIKKFIIK